MAKAPIIVDDPRFHRSLFGSLKDYSEDRPPALYYVENGNFVAGFDQLALDYEQAVYHLLSGSKQSGWDSLTAPLVFIVRQTFELRLKALLEATAELGNSITADDFFTHKLDVLWTRSETWLDVNGYKYREDARCETALWMLENFQAVDPTGDLFRFAHSRMMAFNRQKSYDRAGTNEEVFVPYFEKTIRFLGHWSGVLVAEKTKEICVAEGAEYPDVFDPDDFPKITPAS